MKASLPDGSRDRARRLRRNPTMAEAALWRMLSAGQAGGFRFRRQVPLGPYIADFVCLAARLVVEADGGQHDAELPREAARTAFLEAQGYSVLRFWNHEVLGNPQGVQEAILAELQRRGDRRRRKPSPSMGEGAMADKGGPWSSSPGCA